MYGGISKSVSVADSDYSKSSCSKNTFLVETN